MAEQDERRKVMWQSYPRPQLQRAEWINLNGLWKYAVTDQNTPRKNVSFEGEILDPVCD